jgi:hypothetical protein
MTVNTATSTATYTGNGATTVFPIPFYFLANSDLQVLQKVAATGSTSTLALGTDYVLVGAGVGAGGSLTATVAPASGDTLYVARNVAAVQQTAYPANSPFPAASHEMALDRLTMLAQQTETGLALTLQKQPLASIYDLQGNTLINEAVAVNPADVPNLSQVQQLVAAGQSGIVPANVALLSDLASTATGKGSKLIAFIQRVAGAISRWVEDKLSEQPSVKDFGATGGGTVDDFAAFGLAQTAYPLGFIVPAGSYKIGSALSLTVPVTFMPGAVLIPASGIAVSLSNAIIAGETQIFSVASGGSFSLSNQAANCLLSWFGVAPQKTAAQNTSAFNACIAAMPTSDGCHIRWPAGKVNVNSCSHSKNGVMQEGHAEGTWLINNTTNAFALESLGSGNFHNTFKNFRIGQAVGITPVAGNGGIHIQSQQSKVLDCHCFSFPAPLKDGIFIDGFIAGWVKGNYCSNLLGNGFHFGGGCGDIMADSNYSVGNVQNGFYFNGTSGIYMTNSSCYANNVSAFYFDSTGNINGSGTINEYFLGSNLIGDTSGSNNWNILSLADSCLTGCWGSSQISTTVNTFAPGFNITGSGCNEISLIGCLSLSNNGDGILVDQGATNIRLIGGESRTNGRGGNAGVNNGIHLGFGAAVTNIAVSGYRCRNNSGGIFLGAFASDYVIISSCNNQGNTGATIVNNSTGTHNAIGTGANV